MGEQIQDKKQKVPTLSICIVTLNNLEYTKLLIAGLHKNTVNSFEILLYINCASWDFIKLAAEWKEQGKIKEFAHIGRNQFVPFPMNTLVTRWATGEFIVYLDDDVYPVPSWDVALCKKVNPDIFYQYLSPVLFSWRNAGENIGAEDVYNSWSVGESYVNFDVELFEKQWKEKRTVTKDSNNVCGNYMIRRALYNQLGGYDHKITWGWDADMKANLWDVAYNSQNLFEFRAVADCCFYHFRCNSIVRVGRPRQSGNYQFKEKWGISISEWDKLSKQNQVPINLDGDM